MKINARIALDVSHLDAGEIVPQILVRAHADIMDECERALKTLKTDPEHKKRDFEESVEYLRAMEKVMSYYMMHYAYTSWYETHSVAARLFNERMG